MYIKIKMIQVMDRIRKETGDLKPLIDSIREHGLINPITVMDTREGYVLIAGYRRLQAVKALGEHDIVATVLDPKDADEQLKMEIDENEVRKDFTIREKLAYADKIKVIEQANVVFPPEDEMKTRWENILQSIQENEGNNSLTTKPAA